MNAFWIILGVVGASAVLLGIGAALGRWSRRDDIDELENRLDHAERSIRYHIDYEDNVDAAYREVSDILEREQVTMAELRAELGRRQIGARPVWAQCDLPEPLPIDASSLRWAGSAAGHTGQWSIVAPFEIVDLAAGELVAA